MILISLFHINCFVLQSFFSNHLPQSVTITIVLPKKFQSIIEFKQITHLRRKSQSITFSMLLDFFLFKLLLLPLPELGPHLERLLFSSLRAWSSLKQVSSEMWFPPRFSKFIFANSCDSLSDAPTFRRLDSFWMSLASRSASLQGFVAMGVTFLSDVFLELEFRIYNSLFQIV